MGAPVCARAAALARVAVPALTLLLGVLSGARADDLLCPTPQSLRACLQAGGILCPTVEPRPPASALRETRPDPNAIISATADRGEGKLTPDGIEVLEGNVIVHQGDRQIRADNAQYDRGKNQLTAQGSVVYDDPLVELSGSQGHYSPVTGADVQDAQFLIKHRTAHGTARLLELSPQGVLAMRQVTFTTCPLSSPSWQLRAGALTLNTSQEMGTGRGVSVDFEGVPVLYLPWLSFPLSDERKSGFLFPSFGNSSTSGFELEVPYYWNLAPNADLTFDPIYYSSRGVDVSGDTRWLTSDQSGIVQWHYLPDDRELDGRDRSFVSLQDVLQLPDLWRLRVDAEDASDTQYFSNFGTGPESTSTAFLQRIAQLTYRDENWSLGAEAQQYQTIDLTLPDAYRPYARAPRLFADGDFGFGPNNLFRYGIDSELVDFVRPLGPTGWRLDLDPHVGFDYEAPGYFARSSLAWRYTRYELQGPWPGEPTAPSRELPTASFDTGLLFDGPVGASRTLTLEPHLQYVYTPYRDQSDLPLFDTTIPDINMVELFRTDRFVGADRVSDEDQMTLGVTSRLVNSTSGEQYIAGTLGGQYYFEPPRVQDIYATDQYMPIPVYVPGLPPTDEERKASDLVAEVVLSAYKNFNVNLNLAYGPSTHQEERTFVQLQYKPGGESVINVAWRYQRSVAPEPELLPGVAADALAASVSAEKLDQAEVSGAWPIARNWNVLARMVYDFAADQSLDRFAGFEYTSCCWRVRLLVRRYLINGTGAQDTAALFQIQLGGLAGVGPATDTFLGNAIQGYSPPSLSRSTARSSLGAVSLFPP